MRTRQDQSPLAMTAPWATLSAVAWVIVCAAATSDRALAQSVCLPSPRLLTVMPMGGQAGTEVEVVISGEELANAEAVVFSDPAITAIAKTNEDGTAIPNHYIVRIDSECATGVVDMRVMAPLGLSTARAFTVGELPEVTQTQPTTSLDQAMSLAIDSVCNANLVARSINHYQFEAKAGQELMIDCVAKGIDSKMNPVVILGDQDGNDLVAQRRGGRLRFEVPEDGTYTIKIHDLTFNGGPFYFFRLAIREIHNGQVPDRLPQIAAVSTCSWPPAGLGPTAVATEAADDRTTQEIQLPCDLAGSFFPAADVDTFVFTAQQGEKWCVEVASNRLGRPTDPFVIVQQQIDNGSSWKDLAELADIASPVKVSSNHYSYDGPPYHAGSSDVMGMFEVPADGTYRVQLRDLFGGTRNDPDNVYRLIIRKPKPDFALAGWALHMELRNGDRNALSKPIALRGGAIMPIEVVAIRRDGFDGPIELRMQDLPEGVRATGLTIASGKSRGIVLVQADENAPRGMSLAKISGTATIDDQSVVREVAYAAMKWPVKDARSEIPDPRRLMSVPVSVGGVESAALSFGLDSDDPTRVIEAPVGEPLKVPLRLTRRGEFSGKRMLLSTFGAGFEKATKIEMPLDKDQCEITLDLAKLKTPPGEYQIAFYGGAVVKYVPVTIGKTEDAGGKAKTPPKPKDIVDIFVSEPFTIRVVSDAEVEPKENQS